MKAVILAAGEGTRLRPKTDDTPKPLVEVNGRPILTDCLETVRDIGLDEAIIVVGYLREQIQAQYGDSFRGLDITYVHQAERKGLAHAVWSAGDHISAPFVLLNGDNIYRANLSAVVEHHQSSDAALTFPVSEVPPAQATRGAVCELDEAGNVVGMVEKPSSPPSGCVPAGFYVLPPEIVPACRIVRPSARGEYELPDAIDLLLYSGYQVETVPFEGWKKNINTPEDIEEAEKWLQTQ